MIPVPSSVAIQLSLTLRLSEIEKQRRFWVQYRRRRSQGWFCRWFHWLNSYWSHTWLYRRKHYSKTSRTIASLVWKATIWEHLFAWTDLAAEVAGAGVEVGISDRLCFGVLLLLFARWFGLMGYNAVSARLIGVQVNDLRKDSSAVASVAVSLSSVQSLSISGISGCCIACLSSAPVLQVLDKP